MKKNKIILFYMPVIHRGYLNFVEEYTDIKEIGILDEDLIAESDYLRKEIRSLTPKEAAKSFFALFPEKSILIINAESLKSLAVKGYSFVLPDEDIFDIIKKKYLHGSNISRHRLFLRWNRKNSLQEENINFDEEIDGHTLMSKAMKLRERSSDWWRQVGALIVKNGKIILVGYNKHLPTDHNQYIDGDPRNCFFKGVEIELGTAIHAERHLIAQAAKYGIAINGCELYVTTFPCPGCAKQICEAGIKKVFYSDGYAVLDAENILKAEGIKIIHIKEAPGYTM